MNQKEKEVFITAMINTIKVKILSKVGAMPLNWDGIELRWLIKESFKKIATNETGRLYNRRYRDYRNERMVRNI